MSWNSWRWPTRSGSMPGRPSGSFTRYPKNRYSKPKQLSAAMPTIEDMIYQRWDEERARASAFSFAPIYRFLSAITPLARMDERQAIVDLVRETRQQGRGKN